MLNRLYQDEIIALSRRSRGRGRLDAPQHTARVDNPLCGDRVIMDLSTVDGAVSAVGHQVRGCALCEAAAEIIAENSVGMTVADVVSVGHGVRDYLRTGATDALVWPQLSVFEPVRDVTSRHDCVLLPFTAVRKATDSA